MTWPQKLTLKTNPGHTMPQLCLLSLVFCLLSLVSCLLILVSWLFSLVSCLFSIVFCLLSLVSCLLSLVHCLLSIDDSLCQKMKKKYKMETEMEMKDEEELANWGGLDKEDWTEEDWTINLRGVWGDLYMILIPVLCFQLLLRYDHGKSRSYSDLRQR